MISLPLLALIGLIAILLGVSAALYDAHRHDARRKRYFASRLGARAVLDDIPRRQRED